MDSRNFRTSIITTFIVGGLFIWLLVAVLGPKSAQPHEYQETSGRYTDYANRDYGYVIGTKDGKNVATFDPLLPRDDTTLTFILYRLVSERYEDKITNAKPIIVERDGVSLISLESDKGRYYFETIKEDTGEIHTIVFWEE